MSEIAGRAGGPASDSPASDNPSSGWPARRGGIRARLSVAADWLAAAVMVTLPWSTSATGICIALWLLAFLPTLTADALRREIARPVVILPVLLWAALCAAMLWADVSWGDRLEGLRHYHKLLVLPLVIVHFRRSDRGPAIIAAFVASSAALMLLSWASWWYPGLVLGPRPPGVPVKDHIYLGAFFALSACILVDRAISAAVRQRYLQAAVCFGTSALFVANIAVVIHSRTSAVALPVLLLVVLYRRLPVKAMLPIATGLAVAGFLALQMTPLGTRLAEGIDRARWDASVVTSESQRMHYWRTSLALIAERPLLGHGTGSILSGFEAAGEAAGLPPEMLTRNPHNETLKVGIQLGLFGIALLWSLWLAQIAVFMRRRQAESAAPAADPAAPSALAGVGLLIVVQNVVGSVFNSHISDFTAGWLYVFGAGIVIGTLSAGSAAPPRRPESARPEPGTPGTA